MADIAASVLAKLRNKAKDSGISYQQCLQLFMQEEFLRKLSKSGYDDFLVLKGGLFIYTLTNFESRATIDVDFLLRGYSNSINNVKDLICKIIDTPTGNDYIDMTAKGFEEISPQRKYHGISTQIIGRIKNVRVPFNVDIGVGDVIVPKAEQRKINTQLPDFEAPVIKTYSLESTIAEKFDAILQRFELTGRMKDFYDIYYLSRTFDFEGAKLQSAVFETLQRRGTPYDRNSFKRVVALAEDEDMQKRWKYFLKNIKDNETSDIVSRIQTSLLLVNLYLDNGMDINQIKDVVSIVSGDFDRIYAYSNLIVNFLRKRKRTIDSEINLSSALKEVGGFYQTIVKSFDITLNFVCEDTIEYKIKQIDFESIVINMITNAFEQVKGRENRKITVTISQSASHLIIYFEDSGTGVPEGKEKEIFRPFETTKENGIGLGLNIVKDIVEKYHGDISVKRSETMLGAKFIVTLPKGDE